MGFENQGGLPHQTVVGVFENVSYAQDAVRNLRDQGFTEDEIGVIGRHSNEVKAAAEMNESAAGAGAAAGAMAGAGVGALWGLGIIAGALPAIGPVIAGGALASILASAAGSAAVGGVVGALAGLGVPEEDAKFYDTEMQSGRTIVTVRAGSRAEEATRILRLNGGYDIHSRDSYQSSEEYRAKVAASQHRPIPTPHTRSTTSDVTGRRLP